MSVAGPVSPTRFAIFRIVLGAGLAVQLLAWWPWAEELFGAAGLPAAAGAHLGRLVPSPLPGGPLAVHGSFAVLVALSLALALGVARRTAALLLWYGWSALVHAAPHAHTVASAFVGWLLLATALVPAGEPLRPWGRARPGGGEVPRALWVGAWIVLAAGYGISGWDKLASPGWRAGEALRAAVGMPYAREAGASVLLALPHGLQRGATWAGLGIELGFPVLALVRATRPVAWAAGLALQLGLLVLFAFPGLTFGLLMMHAFVFDERWLARRAGA